MVALAIWSFSSMYIRLSSPLNSDDGIIVQRYLVQSSLAYIQDLVMGAKCYCSHSKGRGRRRGAWPTAARILEEKKLVAAQAATHPAVDLGPWSVSSNSKMRQDRNPAAPKCGYPVSPASPTSRLSTGRACCSTRKPKSASGRRALSWLRAPGPA